MTNPIIDTSEWNFDHEEAAGVYLAAITQNVAQVVISEIDQISYCFHGTDLYCQVWIGDDVIKSDRLPVADLVDQCFDWDMSTNSDGASCLAIATMFEAQAARLREGVANADRWKVQAAKDTAKALENCDKDGFPLPGFGSPAPKS